MKRAIFTLLVLCASAPAFALTLDSPKRHQPIKAEVVDSSPSHYTINVKKAANLGVNQEAPTYAMYVTSSVPKTCADFSKINLNYQKPDKYHRIFDLSDHKDVVNAINDYGCVIIPNKPKHPPARS